VAALLSASSERLDATGPGVDAEALGRRLIAPGSPLLRDLVLRRPWRVIADTATCYAVIALAFVLLARSPTWWAAAVAFLTIGNRQYALSVLTHEGDHSTLFTRRRANDIFAQVALCAPVGVDFHGERVNHRRHHDLLACASDPDRYLYSVEDKSTHGSFLLFLLGLTMFPRALRKALRGGDGPAAAPSLPAALRSFVARRGATLAAQGLIFVAICTRFSGWYYLAFWIAPIYPLVFVPHKVRMFCEHAQPVTPDAAADARRLITFTPGWIERLLFSPYHLNLHAEHHLWPFVPYYNLPRLHAVLAERPEVEVRRSYVGFLVRYFRGLPLGLAAAPEA
jgi:fatty acid desaturase